MAVHVLACAGKSFYCDRHLMSANFTLVLCGLMVAGGVAFEVLRRVFRRR